MIRILVNGSQGKMGQEVIKAVVEDPELELVDSTDEGDDLPQHIEDSKAQVVIDFTTASVCFLNIQKIIRSGAYPVVGTSGLLPEQVHILQQECIERQQGGIIAPNFALGAVLMMKYAQDAAKYFSDVEIIEWHHPQKADSPSGTAIKTASLIAKNRKSADLHVGHEILAGARGAVQDGIHIHSIRVAGVVAHQEVIFGGSSETLILQHHSTHRESFMPGVRLACKKVVHLKELVYGLEHIL